MDNGNGSEGDFIVRLIKEVSGLDGEIAGHIKNGVRSCVQLKHKETPETKTFG